MNSKKRKGKGCSRDDVSRVETGRFIYESYDKYRIQSLPQELFEGNIVVVETAASARNCVDYLSRQHVLGIDTETRPSFRRGQSYKVSLLQVSTREECFLFRLHMMGLPPSLIELLSDGKQLKIGLSLDGDFSMLRQREKFTPGRFVDLQKYVGIIGITDMSLQKLYANIFGRRISKAVRLSNWEASVLSEAQKRYAATDAWACIKLYEEIGRLNSTHDYCFIPKVSEEELLDEVIEELLKMNEK